MYVGSLNVEVDPREQDVSTTVTHSVTAPYSTQPPETLQGAKPLEQPELTGVQMVQSLPDTVEQWKQKLMPLGWAVRFGDMQVAALLWVITGGLLVHLATAPISGPQQQPPAAVAAAARPLPVPKSYSGQAAVGRQAVGSSWLLGCCMLTAWGGMVTCLGRRQGNAWRPWAAAARRHCLC